MHGEDSTSSKTIMVPPSKRTLAPAPPPKLRLVEDRFVPPSRWPLRLVWLAIAVCLVTIVVVVARR